MPLPTLTTEPVQVVQGTDVAWEIATPGTPPPAWVVTYYFDGPGEFELVGSDAGNGRHRVELSAAASSALAPGTYRYQALAMDGDETSLVRAGPLEVVASHADQTLTGDQRSHAEVMLEAIEAALENRATKDQQSYTIEGRSLERLDFRELRRARAQYRAELEAERRAAVSGRAPRRGPGKVRMVLS